MQYMFTTTDTTPTTDGSQLLGPQHPLTSTHSSDRPTSVERADLLRGQKAVEILHNGSVYRLQATRLGKLILTK